jgi:hypothetical protein
MPRKMNTMRLRPSPSGRDCGSTAGCVTDRGKKILFNAILAEAEASSHHPRIELSCPNCRPPLWEVNDEFRTQRQQQPGDAWDQFAYAVLGTMISTRDFGQSAIDAI